MSFNQNVSSFAVKGGGGGSVAAPVTVPNDSESIIGTVVSNSARQNVYSTGSWTSSGPWTTYYHSWQDANSKIQGFNMFMGDGHPNGTNQGMFVNDGENAMSRVKEYAHGNRVGNHYKDMFYYSNSSGNYSGVTWRCIPVRNTTGASITRTLNTYLSSVDTSYGGCGIFVYTPNTGVYSTTTEGTWTIAYGGGGSTPSAVGSGSVTIPANTTVLVFVNSTHYYQTTYRFKDTNMLYNLNTFIGDGLVCDLRMLETVATARIGDYSSNTSSNPWKLYPACATTFGDR